MFRLLKRVESSSTDSNQKKAREADVEPIRCQRDDGIVGG